MILGSNYYKEKNKAEKRSSFTIYKPGISSYVFDIDIPLKQMKNILT
jgi:hypothetical protein